MEATGKINYTIIVDQSCYLYLNNQLIQKLEADKKIKLSLTPGEYNRKVVAIDNPSSLNEEKITISADKTFKDDIELCDVVDAVPVEVVPLVPKQEFKKHDIFISYRQRISNHKAKFLFTNLDSRFKNRVLRDLEEFELGRWINQIIYGVEHCKVFFCIIDEGTLDNLVNSQEEIEMYKNLCKLPYDDLIEQVTRLHSEDSKRIDYVRIEIGRALYRESIGELKFVPIFKNGLEMDTYPDDVKFDTNQGITFNGEDFYSLVDVNSDKVDKIIKGLDTYLLSQWGKNIKATDIYYDSNRAKEKFGFDETFYIPRKVDEELVRYVEQSEKSPFCFITGLPGSGKTRAIYQLCHGALSEQSVIILTKSNVNTIADLLSSDTRKIDSQYILCDQIIDVLFVLDEEKRKTFIDKLCDSNYYHLIGSNTKARLDDFLKEYSEYIKCKLIEIPIIDKSIINRLIKHLKAQGKEIKVENGKTIADLIPGINEYKKAILNSLLKKTVKNEKKYLELLHDWLKSLQLVMTFRKEYRLFLAILVFKQLSERRDAQFDINWLRTCIQAMLGLNMLYLQDNNKSISKNDIGQKFIKITTANFEYDGEYFLDIMGKYIDKSESKNCIFEVNELIWQYLLDKTDTFKSKQFEEVLYDFSDEDDLQEAIEIYYAAFPTLSSLRRIIPRIPDGSVQAAANAKVINILEEKYIIDEVIDNEENLVEIQNIYSLIIGRCTCNEEVEAYLTQLIDKKIISLENYPGIIIGELYRYAENSMDIYSRNYIEYVENIRKKRYYIQISDFKIDLQADCQTNLKGDDLYAIEKEINALLRLKKIKLDFESLKSYLSKCFDRLRLKEKNILNDDKLLVNINRLLNLLVRYSHVDNGNIEAISELLRTYNLLDKESGIYPIYTIFKYLAKYTNGSPEKCKCIVDQLIYANSSCRDADWNLNEAVPKVKEFFGWFVVSAIAQADTFSDAVQLYELYTKGLLKDVKSGFIEEDVDKYKVLGMAMRKCTATEFQTMVAYLEPILKNLRTQLLNSKQQNKQLDIWYINYTIKVLTNLLMEKSPSQTDAMYYLEQLDAEQVDSYALFHVLKKVKKNANRQEQFIWAYSVINHPKLEKFRSEVQILNLLFSLTNDIEQEKLIDEIAGEKKKNNVIYLSIKLGKEFRSLSEKTDLYKQFYANDNEGEENALRRVDLFSTASKELWKAKKRYNTLKKEYEKFSGLNPDVKGLKDEEIKVLNDEITKVEKFLKEESRKDFRDNDSDPYYTLALIQLGELNVFDDKNEIAIEFTESHLSRFVTIKHWNSLINLFRNENDKDAEIKIKELCKLYKEKYDGTKRSYLLRPDDMMRRCLNKVGVNLDEDNIEESEILASEYTEGEEVLFETSEPETGEDYVDDNELIFSKDESGHVYLNEHFDKIKQCDDAKNVIWWTKKINWAKKHKEEEKIRCIYNSYLDFLKEYNSVASLQPDWMMYKYAFDKSDSRDVDSVFSPCDLIMKELENPTIMPSRLADVLEHVCNLQKIKKEIPTIRKIMDTIDNQDLWRMIEVDHRSLVSLYLFILRQTTEREEFLDKYKARFDKLDHIANNNLKSLGELSRTEILMTHNSLRCTLYFYKWLQGYLDIYKSEKVFLKHYSDDNTIKIHVLKRKSFDPLFREYLESNDEFRSLIVEIDAKRNQILSAETLGTILECYKGYTIETLRNIYNDLHTNLQTQLVYVEDNISVQVIIDALNKYVNLKDKIIEFYETNSKDILKAAILGSAKSQYEYGKRNDSYMIISALRWGHQESVNESVRLLHFQETKSSLKIKIYQALESIDYKFNQGDWYVVAKAYQYCGKFSQYIECCKKAADLGHALAAYELWKIYEEGRKIEKSLDQSRFWMKRAAELKHPDAQKTQHNLDELLKSFEGVKADKFKDLALLQELANKGLAEAQQCLGAQYYNLAFGSNLAKEKLENYKQAYQYFMKAANQGFAISQYYVGFCFETGNGVEKDSNEAKKWYQLAANQGHQSAIDKLQNLM